MKADRREELWWRKRVRNGVSRPRSSRARRVRAALVALMCLAVLSSPSAVLAGAPALANSDGSRAHAARVLNVRDEGRLHYVKSSGELIIDEGHASGSFPGSVKVRFLYDGEPTVSARFTISGSSGSIYAHGTGRLSSPTSSAPSFHGSFTVTGGSGFYSHVHGGGELYGVYYRRTYALTVQAIGKLPY